LAAGTLSWIQVSRLAKPVVRAFRVCRYAVEHVWHVLTEVKRRDARRLKRITGIGERHDLLRAVRQERILLSDGEDRRDVRVFRDRFPAAESGILEEADRVCGHVFDLLGSGPCRLSPEGRGYQPIDWHVDFKSGRRWPKRRFYRWIRPGKPGGGDIIVPWELSRFQGAPRLAQAFRLSGNEAYRREFITQVGDWITNNRFRRGVNWVSAMDAGVRAANWLVTLDFLGSRRDLPEDFLIRLHCSLYDHGRHIRRRLLRIGRVTHNHYVAGLAGLLFIGLYCPFFKRSRRWVDFAVSGLEEEIRRQVYADGCDFEASTSYHLLVLEFFFYSILLCDRAGVRLSEAYRRRLRQMAEVVYRYLKPDGTAPQIGDNDNGRFFKFRDRPVLRHDYILAPLAAYFREDAPIAVDPSVSEEVFWLFGPRTGATPRPRRVSAQPAEVTSFPQAGWYVLRHKRHHCFVSCGPSGQGGIGGHAHNDKLSFELVLNGIDVIVDPGTYAYTGHPGERNRFRSTFCHNTVAIEGVEQNEIDRRNLFRLAERVSIHRAEAKAHDDELVFLGDISYAGIRHRRILRLHRRSGRLRIEDRVSSPVPGRAFLRFHLAPRVVFRDGCLWLEPAGEKIAALTVDDRRFDVFEYDYSPQYGSRIECLGLAVSFAVGPRPVRIRSVVTAAAAGCVAGRGN